MGLGIWSYSDVLGHMCEEDFGQVSGNILIVINIVLGNILIIINIFIYHQGQYIYTTRINILDYFENGGFSDFF